MPQVPLDHALPHEKLRLLRRLGESAHAHGARLWLVGGAVRDALLGRPVLDLDLTSETPASELGPRLVLDAGGRAGSLTTFGTMKLSIEGASFDLATARSERYARPGALPEVAPGDMLQDLARRDVSINAMAASLAPDGFGDLLDTEGGLRDLSAGVVRALHERTFQDDATRMLRIARYAARLGFRIDRATLRWLRRDLGYLDSISGARLRRELERMLEEPNPLRSAVLAHRLGVLGAIDPSLGTEEVLAALRRAGRRGPSPMAALGVLVYPVSRDDAVRVVQRLGLTHAQSKVVRQTVELAADERRLREADRLSTIGRIAGPASDAAIEAVAAATPDPRVRAKLRRYLRVSPASLPLSGADLMALGVPAGHDVGAMLAAQRDAVLDGRVRSRAGAIALIKRTLQEATE